MASFEHKTWTLRYCYGLCISEPTPTPLFSLGLMLSPPPLMLLLLLQVHEGVPISCIILPHNPLDTSAAAAAAATTAAAAALLGLCSQHGIQVRQQWGIRWVGWVGGRICWQQLLHPPRVHSCSSASTVGTISSNSSSTQWSSAGRSGSSGGFVGEWVGGWVGFQQQQLQHLQGRTCGTHLNLSAT
jgi:hypothetical protein